MPERLSWWLAVAQLIWLWFHSHIPNPVSQVGALLHGQLALSRFRLNLPPVAVQISPANVSCAPPMFHCRQSAVTDEERGVLKCSLMRAKILLDMPIF